MTTSQDQQRGSPQISPLDLSAGPQFKADEDQRGDWWVWRRVSAKGWATMRRCETREDAERLAEALNEGEHPEEAARDA